ncbi:MAG TPA: 30S ribosomal protein S17 [Spirochaetaceae bacterium]|nr:30S ribosomal protein S17 [Spirochaetaceae bacterium]
MRIGMVGSRKKTFVGQVTSDKMDKTIVVSVVGKKLNPLYRKYVKYVKKFKAHDAQNSAHIGDKVRIEECRHYSKDKCWMLREIVEKAK